MITTRRITALAATVVAIAGVTAFRARPADYPSALAREAPFGDAVVETGTLSAARLTTYSAPNGVPQAKLLELVAEGTYVHPGDRLMRFDSTALEQDLSREQAARQEAVAEQLRAVNDYKVDELRAASDYDSANVRVESAEQALENQVDGEGKVHVAEADAAAADAAAEAIRTRKAFVDLQPLLARGFITKSELDRAEQAAVHAESAARLANLRAQTLASFERPAAIAKARAEAGIARDTVGREREIAAARHEQAQSAVTLAATRIAQSDTRIVALKAAIAASTVTASGPGLVMYRDVFFGSDRRKPQIGDNVSANQPLLAVPDTTRMIVETRIREIDVTRVSAGGAASVRVDAIPELAAAARIALVGALALEDQARTGTRYFPVTIELDRPDARFRPGMTARVEMPSVSLSRAIVIPVQAVFEHDGDRYCVVLTDGRWRRRAVTVAGVNETEAAIGGGLRPGDRVSLVDPDARR